MSTSFLMALLYCLLFALLNGGINLGILQVSGFLDRMVIFPAVQCPLPSTFKLFLALAFLLPLAVIRLLFQFQARRQGGPPGIGLPGRESKSPPILEPKTLLGPMPVLGTMAVSFMVIGSELVQVSRMLLPLEEVYQAMNQFMEPCPLVVDTAGAFLTIGIIGPIVEELFFRGYLLSGLLRRYNRSTPLLAIGIQALLFGLIHLNPLQFLFATVAGFTLGYLRLWSGTLLTPVLLHVMINSLQLILLYLFPELPLVDPEALGPGEHIPVALLIPAALLFSGGLLLFHRMSRS